MSTMQEAKQQLVSLETEFSRRSVEAENAERNIQQLQASISKWRASMVLDGANFTEKIEKAHTELVEAEAIVQVWPDVKAELNRRLESARTVIKSYELDIKLQTIRNIASDEESIRQQFYAKGLEFLEVADRLVDTLNRKEALWSELKQAGRVVTGIDHSSVPPFYHPWTLKGDGVRLARAEWHLDQ